MRKSRLTWALVAAVALVVVAGVAGGSWLLLRGEESETRGACGSKPYELTVESDDGGLEVNFELTSAAPGERWDVVVRQGDTVLLDGQRTTDEDAEIDVAVPARELGGGEFAVLATSERGEECSATVTHG